MLFRTEIEIPKHPLIKIDHDTPIFMCGSCFTDNIGELLHIDGFNVTHNPMGTIYNPSALLTALQLALFPDQIKPLVIWHDNKWKCLNFATKYSHPDPDALDMMLRADLAAVKYAFSHAKVVIITLGTSFVYEWHESTIVGNCHKIEPHNFSRRMLSVDEVRDNILSISKLCHGKKLIFTISPIRHTADTLHGNQLSKATLLLGLEQALSSISDADAPIYFPAYEIMLDDLRDYRFYAQDMKHPSPMAVDYIYEIFSNFFFSKSTIENCRLQRKMYKRNAHIPILDDATPSN